MTSDLKQIRESVDEKIRNHRGMILPRQFALWTEPEIEMFETFFQKNLYDHNLTQHETIILSGLEKSHILAGSDDFKYNSNRSLSENINSFRDRMDSIFVLTEDYIQRYKKYLDLWNHN